MWNTTQLKKHGWPQPVSWSLLVHKINMCCLWTNVPIICKTSCFQGIQIFLYYPPNTHAWCHPWGLNQARSLERCQLLFLFVFRKMSLPHVAFPALMIWYDDRAGGGCIERKRAMNMTMNWFCQAHAAYKLVRSYFYLQCIVKCDEQNVWTWHSHCSIWNTRLLTKQLSITDFFGKKFICTHLLTLILRRSRTGTVWFYTSTSNKRAARPKLYTKSLTRDLKRMYSRFTLVRISIKL